MSGGIVHGREVTADRELACDVCIVGSGAGGAVLAAGLAERGLSVVLLEAGGAFTKADFDGDEAKAYPMLYQERGAQATDDLSITLLQGRSVGGTTTVNWTTCYRTPDRILKHWQQVHGVDSLSTEVLTPHWEAVEQRLNIGEWSEALVNANNGALLRGARALGWEAHVLHRNVKGCANSGYCGVGCPVDGKQAMHLTYLPDAVASGAVIHADCHVERLEVVEDRVVAVHAVVLDRASGRPAGPRVTVRPKVAVSAGGALHGPALLLRSGLDDHGRVGKRTMIHPVVGVTGQYTEPIRGWYGAPQSVACHHFVDRGPEKVGFFLEVPPLQPMLAGSGLFQFGAATREYMARLEYGSTFIALSIDGLLPGDAGGTVTLRPDGRPSLNYPVGPHLVESFRAAHKAMARAHLAAGATEVASLHAEVVRITREDQVEPTYDRLPYGPLEHAIFSAHLMGGCALGPKPESSVVDLTLCHHRVRNLFVVDGSVFPTSIGVNPSQTIYGIARWAVPHVAGAV